jgi:hypothetical protein
MPLERLKEGGRSMRTLRFRTAIATVTMAGMLGAGTAAPSQARLPESVEAIVPNTHNETIYRPTCWTEDGYERWLRCVSAPDGGVEGNHPRIRGGYRGP